MIECRGPVVAEKAVAQPAMRRCAAVGAGDGVPETGNRKRIVDERGMNARRIADDADGCRRCQLHGAVARIDRSDAKGFDGSIRCAADHRRAGAQSASRGGRLSDVTDQGRRRDDRRQRARIAIYGGAQRRRPRIRRHIEQ